MLLQMQDRSQNILEESASVCFGFDPFQHVTKLGFSKNARYVTYINIYKLDFTTKHEL